MSWQAYVDNSLVGTGQVSKGALFGHDGNQWATSAGFTVSKDEATKLVSGFSNPAPLHAGGVHIAGNKYTVLKADDQSIYGKKGATGVCCCKTGQTLIIAFYDESIQPGSCANTAERLADYLREAGY
eukprot:CAMPEP_0201509764 /NCGR_PEP_ID=MMETSP0161_2-20130828/2716_1 /ASSEMBLY_ACC=CAM_ASM_000251 /TAXON_ID=180227 /ORGANISM="Neoparamoeba aestuarina, Strain SoJaBio B1-5/56/2" /LENGTH=126 /DNA_ID=CAMNT_0047904811 /DNA_START=109 /DNA_END=489 /DNA_ORIENTATION=+